MSSSSLPILSLLRTVRIAAAAGLASAALLAASAGQATAQEAVALPEIVVTTPSKPAKPRKKPAAKAPAASARKAPAQQAPAAAIDVTPEPPPMPDLASAPFAPLSAVTDREIQAQAGATLTDALQTKPGVAGSTFAPGANRPVLRGLDTYRVRVQENGIGSHDVAALSEDHAIPIDPLAAERVQVIRGPESLRYGAQAVGGLVSVENSRIPSRIPQRGYSAAIMGGLTAVDEGRDGAFRVTSGAGPLALHADGFRRHSEDYDTPRGRQLNSFVDSQGGAVGASLIGSEGFIGLSLSHIDSLYGIPGADVAERPRIDMQQDRINAKGEWAPRGPAIDVIRFAFGASDYDHVEIASEDGVDHIGSRFTNREQEGRLELQHTPLATGIGRLTGMIGAQWGHRDMRGQSFEGESLLEPAETDSVAGFIFEELQPSRPLRLQWAARLEHVRVDGSGLPEPDAVALVPLQRSFDAASTSLGALYDLPSDVVARVSGQYIERAPDAAELFSKGVHEATGTFEIGDPDLGIETARSVELGLGRSKGSLRFDASAYYTVYDGFIFKSLTGVGCGDDGCGGGEDELDQVVFAQRDATFYGAELAGELDVARLARGVWGVDARYDFVHAEFANGENVPRIPPHRLGGGLFYRDAAWFARLGLLHAFDQTRIGTNETPTDGYTLLSAEVSYTAAAAPGAPQFTVGLKGENLADDEVRNHVSFKKDEVLQPGANVRLFGVVRFN
jgi:iron complex outermembrane receptor protein